MSKNIYYRNCIANGYMTIRRMRKKIQLLTSNYIIIVNVCTVRLLPYFSI